MQDFNDYSHSGFQISGPPRHVPLSVKVRIFLGGALNQIGWFIFAFGSIFFWIAGSTADTTSWTHFSGSIETANGVVTQIEKTGVSTGGDEHSDGTPIYAIHFTFKVNGTEYESISYETGKSVRVGAKVTVEYPTDNPSVSRIKGMRCNLIEIWILLVGIFPLIGIIMVVCTVKKSMKGCYLLVNGLETTGRLINTEATGTEINNQTVMKYTFAFTADDNVEYEVTAKSHTGELTDEAEERLMYDEYDPGFAIMMDSLPGSPAIDSNGEIRGSLGKTLLVMALPIITIVGNVLAYNYVTGS